MWFRAFKDYPPDTPLRHEKVEPGKGITGCEMHEINGWGEEQHRYRKPRKGMISRMLDYWFGSEGQDER